MADTDTTSSADNAVTNTPSNTTPQRDLTPLEIAAIMIGGSLRGVLSGLGTGALIGAAVCLWQNQKIKAARKARRASRGRE